MSSRIFLVGTDTNAGKTVVACALLRAAKQAGIAAIPFKPAESGPSGPASDHGRLIASSTLTSADAKQVAPLRWARPIAPGLADDAAPFLGRGVSRSDPASMFGQARWALAQLEQRHAARLSIIEGAGGLLVPMPGGTWLPEWIEALRARPLIVARAGLGTINHTLLTIEALRIRELEPIGMVFTQLLPRDDPSREHNARVIEARSGVPCLGQLPFLGRPPSWPERHTWHSPDLWSCLLDGGPIVDPTVASE